MFLSDSFHGNAWAQLGLNAVRLSRVWYVMLMTCRLSRERYVNIFAILYVMGAP